MWIKGILPAGLWGNPVPGCCLLFSFALCSSDRCPDPAHAAREQAPLQDTA